MDLRIYLKYIHTYIYTYILGVVGSGMCFPERCSPPGLGRYISHVLRVLSPLFGVERACVRLPMYVCTSMHVRTGIPHLFCLYVFWDATLLFEGACQPIEFIFCVWVRWGRCAGGWWAYIRTYVGAYVWVDLVV